MGSIRPDAGKAFKYRISRVFLMVGAAGLPAAMRGALRDQLNESLRAISAFKPMASRLGSHPTALTPMMRLGDCRRFFPAKQWSGRRDSNPRPLRPERSALPDCATPRLDVGQRVTRVFYDRAGDSIKEKSFSLGSFRPLVKIFAGSRWGPFPALATQSHDEIPGIRLPASRARHRSWRCPHRHRRHR